VEFGQEELLEKDQHNQLEKLARDSGRSMSELVWEVVAEYLNRASEEESVRTSLAAVDDLAKLRERTRRKRGCLPTVFLDEMREERGAEISP
jgi:hypothetical protein